MKTGKSIFWEKITSTFTEWYKDSCTTTSQASKFNSGSDNNSGDSIGDGVGYNEDCFICGNSIGDIGSCLPKYVQDYLWIYHFCLHHAPFWYWRSLCYWWCSGLSSLFFHFFLFIIIHFFKFCYDDEWNRWILHRFIYIYIYKTDDCGRDEHFNNSVSEVWHGENLLPKFSFDHKSNQQFLPKSRDGWCRWFCYWSFHSYGDYCCS